LSRESYSKVFNLAYRLSGNRSDAEEITQEAFFRGWRGFTDFRSDRPFDNWIMRITSRLFFDLLRSNNRRLKTVSYDAQMIIDGSDGLYFDIVDPKTNPEKLLLNTVLGEDMQFAMDSLTEQQSQLIEMADLQEIPYQEISKRIGRPLGTVRSRLHRTHRSLQDTLEARARQTEQASCDQPDSSGESQVISGSLRAPWGPRRTYSKGKPLPAGVDSIGEKK
jgi:RNA polymerase sigma-70 factor (ECF subfamily)